MSSRIGRAGHYLLLTALWALLCLPNLGGPSLWDIDEGNNATCAREMQASGNLVVPTFNYQLRIDKPVLLYWSQIACAHFIGMNEWAARLPSALAALLTVLALYELGRQTFDPSTAFLAGVILITSFGVLGAAHFANPDALLLAFTTLTLALFWHDYRSGARGWLVGVGIASGLAVLAKGPVGVVLPAAVCLGFLAWQRHLSRLLDLRLSSMVLAFLLVAAPWYIQVGLETKGAWLVGFLGKHNVDRFLSPMENHSGPIFYYLLVLLVGLGPWSIFLAPTVWHTFRRLRDRIDDPDSHEQPALRFLLVWFAVYLVAFSLASTKLPNYILPAYPAAALFLAHFLARWQRGEVAIPSWVPTAGLAVLALAGVGVTAGLLVAGGWGEWELLRGRSFPGLASWSWSGGILAAGAALGWKLWRRGSVTAHSAASAGFEDSAPRMPLRGVGGVIAAVACSTALFAAVVVGPGLEAMEPDKAARFLAEALPEDQTRRDVRLASYCYFQPSLVFYCRREIERFQNGDEAVLFLEGQLPCFLFLPEEVWSGLRERWPATLRAPGRVLARHRDLYSGKMIVVVTNE